MYRDLTETKATEPEFVDFRVNHLQSDATDRECKELAFAEIVNEFSAPLKSFVKGILGNNNPMACDAAEDIVQEVFLRAWGAMDRLKIEHKRSLSVWLYTIAHNITLNNIRYNKNHEAEYFMDGDPDTAVIASDFTNPQTVLDFHSTIKEMDTIPLTERRALLLTTLFGYSYGELAKREKVVSENAIKAKVSRGRTCARAIIKESLLYT